MDSQQKYLKTSDLSKKLGVSRSWILLKVKAGIMPHVRIGAVIRFQEKDVDAWMQAHKVKGCLKI